ncbi:MAG: hypothetical protein GY856_21035, partial [bacterium]|nr:hypothetical protein [bacterium]
DLRMMMELKLRRDGADAEWTEINALLEKAGQNRDPAFTLSPADPRDFDANLEAAAGGTPNYDGLPQVENVNDLYDQRIRQDAQEFIRDQLYFAELDDFVRMMQIKVRIDAEWDEVNRILETAGRRKDPSFRFATGFDPAAFDANLTAAVGPVDFSSLTGVADVDAYYAALLVVEDYFFMLAAEYAYVMDVADKGMAAATPAEWEKVDPILTAAHRDKVYAGRRLRLKQIREADGFTAMIRHALGEEPGEGEDPAVLDRLRPYLGNDAEYELLETAATGEEADQDWDRVYEVVEVAQRNREALPAPVPRKVEWLNLHSAADATAVTDSPDGWKTFGAPADPDPAADADAAAEAENEPSPVLGWGVRSPQLALSTGSREITLTLGFDPEHYDAAALRPLVEGERLIQDSPFRFEVTTEKGWVEPSAGVGALGGYETLSATSGAGHQDLQALQFRLTFPADVDPIVAAPGEAWPTLRLMLRQLIDERTARYVTHYPPFRHLRLAAVHLRVAVSGLAGVQLRNDDRTLDANKPFEPFGTSPAAGSRLVVGHPELVTKRLDRLTFHLEWMGLPDDLTAHYRNYGLAAANFTTRVSLVDRRVEEELASAAPLFSAANAIEITTEGPERSLVDSFPDELLSWERYLQWELGTPDLQHGRYPVVAAEKATAMAAAIAAG